MTDDDDDPMAGIKRVVAPAPPMTSSQAHGAAGLPAEIGLALEEQRQAEEALKPFKSVAQMLRPIELTPGTQAADEAIRARRHLLDYAAAAQADRAGSTFVPFGSGMAGSMTLADMALARQKEAQRERDAARSELAEKTAELAKARGAVAASAEALEKQLRAKADLAAEVRELVAKVAAERDKTADVEKATSTLVAQEAAALEAEADVTRAKDIELYRSALARDLEQHKSTLAKDVEQHKSELAKQSTKEADEAKRAHELKLDETKRNHEKELEAYRRKTLGGVAIVAFLAQLTAVLLGYFLGKR